MAAGDDMSLKSFHIVFIALSIVLAVGFGVWEVGEYTRAGGASHLVLAIVSFVIAAALAVYGLRFLRKLRHIGFL